MDKCDVAADSERTAEQVRGRLGDLAGRRVRGAEGATMLGVDVRAGRRCKRRGRRGPSRRERVRKARKRGERIARMCRVCKSARKLYTTGALPGLTYGMEVTGATDAVVREGRGAVATFKGHKYISRDVLGAGCLGSDPLSKMAVMAVQRYAEEWWRATDTSQRNGRVLRPGLLSDAHGQAVRRWTVGEMPAGPVGQALAMLKWAGWRPVNATTFKRRGGSSICVVVASPAAVAKAFKQDVQAETEARAVVKVWGRLQVPPDQRREPWWELVQKCLNGKRFSNLQKHILLQAIGRGVAHSAAAQRLGLLDQPGVPVRWRCGWNRAQAFLMR